MITMLDQATLSNAIKLKSTLLLINSPNLTTASKHLKTDQELSQVLKLP